MQMQKVSLFLGKGTMIKNFKNIHIINLLFDEIAQGDKEIFLKLFDGLKENVKSNPNMLYKNYWKQKVME